MEKGKVDEIAQAILEPHLKAQEEAKRKIAAAKAAVASKRRIARFTVAGYGVGAAIAYCMGVRITPGIILGGLAGWAVGWLITRRTV